MKTPKPTQMLQSIQTLIEREEGAPLPLTVRLQLEAALKGAVQHAMGLNSGEDFSTRVVTILFTDLRGFTAILESHPAPELLDVLNRYLIRMSEIAFDHGGTIDKFIGDSIMVLFGAPNTHEDDVKRAVTCAVDMQIALFEMNKQNKKRGLPELNMGIGINTGTLMAGVLGSEIYAEYTVIGEEVNLASRIEAYSLRGQILVSEATYLHVRDHVLVSAPTDVYVKGKKDPVNLYEILGIPSANKVVPRQEIRKSPRVETNISFKFQLLRGKSVAPEQYTGTVLDISYNGVLALLDIDVPAQSDIKLDLNLAVVGASATDLYARVRRMIDRDGRRLAGMEFTSVSPQSSVCIRRFVQLMIQGGDSK